MNKARSFLAAAILAGSIGNVKDGAVIQRNLEQEGIDRDELDSAIREHGLEHLADVRLAVLEPDGSVSVIPASAPVLRSRRQVRQVRRH